MWRPSDPKRHYKAQAVVKGPVTENEFEAFQNDLKALQEKHANNGVSVEIRHTVDETLRQPDGLSAG